MDHPEHPVGIYADHTIDLRAPVYAYVTDFLELANEDNQAADKLRRCDLAILRLHVRIMPDTLAYPGDHLPMMRDSIKRLLAAGLLDEHWEVPETYITDDGRQVVRANSSCLDGTENLPTAPGRVRDFLEMSFPPQTQFLLAAPVKRAPTKTEYAAALVAALADTLPSPAVDLRSPLYLRRPLGRRLFRGCSGRQCSCGCCGLWWLAL
ncbi:MAG: hypothetical protein ABSC06_17110 [Rhodopila sp.]|jgi:hypothetical protein